MYPYMNDIGTMMWVNSREELNNVTVAPNKQKVFFLRSAENPLFYVVSANEIGMINISTYKFEEYVEQRPEEKFVTKDEFKKLIDMLGGVKNESSVQA